MNAFKELVIKIVNAGTADLGLMSKKRALRVFNTLVFFNSPTPAIVSLMLMGWKILYTLPFISAAAMSISFLLIPLLHHRQKFLAAQIAYYVPSCAAILIHVYYFGPELHLEFSLLTILIGAFTYIDEARVSIIYAILVICCYLLAVVIIHFTIPVHYLKTSFWVHLSFVIIMLSIITQTLALFKFDKEKYEKLIFEKNEELELRNEEITRQRDVIDQTHKQLILKSDDVTAGIQYAQTIQSAILPAIQEFRNSFNDFFIFYRPRDIVSGDYYWHLTLDSKVYFATADCTGHGVAGAFMSLLGSSILNSLVNTTKSESPNLILKNLDKQITHALNRNGQEMHEGMEITLCIYDQRNRTLKISSANRPYFLVKDNEIMEFRGRKTGIGGEKISERLYDVHEHQIGVGDRLYLFTDGITDQFDSRNERKYSLKKLKVFIGNTDSTTLEQQGAAFENEMMCWQGGNYQTDDMLMIGVQF